MEHMREQLLSELACRLTGLHETGSNIYRARVYPQESAKLPSINILQGPDQPLADGAPGASYHYVDHLFGVTFELRVRATSDIDTTVNRITQEITETLMDDITQGITGVYDTIEDLTSEPELSGEGEQPTARVDMLWRFRYRTLRTDPSRAT